MDAHLVLLEVKLPECVTDYSFMVDTLIIVRAFFYST